jgi:hypothetical protein
MQQSRSPLLKYYVLLEQYKYYLQSSVSRVGFPVVGFTLITKMGLSLDQSIFDISEGKCIGMFIYLTHLQLCKGIPVDPLLRARL